MTALMLAVSSEASNPERVRALLKAGADVNAKSKTGETALDWALKFGNPEIVSILRGADAKEGVPFHAPRRPAVRRASAKEALEPALALLDKSANEFFKQSGCVGCHHQPLAAVALNAGHRTEAANGLLQMIESRWTADQEENIEGVYGGGSPDDDGYFGWAWESGGRAPTAITDTVAVRVALQQNWPVTGTSATFRARRCRKAILPGRRGCCTSAGLRTAGAQSRIPAPHRAGARLAGEIAAQDHRRCSHANHGIALGGRQHGGASQDAGGATARRWRLAAECAISRATRSLPAKRSGRCVKRRVKDNDAAYRSGVRYLLDTQWPDGSWYVRSRAPKFQPYFQSGFPFEHDQWISAAGTAWAVLALAGS